MKNAPFKRSRWLMAGSVIAVAALAVIAFIFGLTNSPGQMASAEADPTEVPWFMQLIPGAPGLATPVAGTRTPDVEVPVPATPAPGETPDFTEPGWYRKWLLQDQALPRFDIVINGISVGPDVIRSGSPCDESHRPVLVADAEAQGSRVAIEFSHLPSGSRVSSPQTVACGGEPAASEVTVRLPSLSPSEIQRRVAEGESFFDLPHGGRLSVLRIVGDPALESSIPVARWSAGTIAGNPAAIGRPVLDGGLGSSAVIVYHDGVLTAVRGSDLSLDEIIRISEGLFE